jgi:hypothetical protein
MNGTHFSFVQISAGRHASPAGPRRVRRKPGQSHAIHERRDSATAYPWSKWWRLINRCSLLSTKPSSPSRRPTHAASPHAAVPAWALGTPPPPPPLPISFAATIPSFPLSRRAGVAGGNPFLFLARASNPPAPRTPPFPPPCVRDLLLPFSPLACTVLIEGRHGGCRRRLFSHHAHLHPRLP